MVIVVDYGLGNLGSVFNMVKKLGFEVEISQCPDKISKADKLILAGVGSFDNGMIELESRGLIEVLNKAVIIDKVPILGICLGMQLMTRGSDEGNLSGLAWIDAYTNKFNLSELPIPHMGWNNIEIKKSSILFKSNHNKEFRYYFVHSYYVKCEENSDVLCESNYGIDFHSAFELGNIFGVQFHPEKSHKFGLTLLNNFLNN